ncbi:alpha/beta hydrolase [Mycoplasma bradburyae]|uniref:Alpha/beta hydrolase n=1 Tax=Mycoplasma bradburyae TaxID=2963128 RepID=A0AAW6HNL6_9MOLU|nr:alpha/beta hydrolase [Mycoplasma bradburyae]MDC4163371.1 alpha/beta hydrolase [Mycoplasma bradburyae]MDC4181985.1 alpha/beta hydrolase [Mycoplasma bradburyae]MDC4182688.1 alpha/beta hydrolase [Mycoplasma bradburyae]MDC4183360.1 alpha/beta hydrolase [Mycoplasma bradburyae]MDC4184168.1 alpha/beta hydrolase [Mycoplasma bradburyae]
MLNLDNTNFSYELKIKKHKYNAVFVHGFSSSHTKHSEIFSRLNKEQVNYYTFDLPGHGKHYIDENDFDKSQLKLDYLSDLVVDFINKKQLDNVILIGHSMGGGICSIVNYLIPQKIKALILEAPLNPAIFSFDKKRIFDSLKSFNNKSFLDILKQQDEVNDQISLIGWLKKIYTNNKDKIPLFLNLISQKSKTLLDNAYKTLNNKPVLLIFGENDPVIPPNKSINYISQYTNNLTTRIIDEAAHLPHQINKEMYYYFIKDFIAKLK